MNCTGLLTGVKHLISVNSLGVRIPHHGSRSSSLSPGRASIAGSSSSTTTPLTKKLVFLFSGLFGEVLEIYLDDLFVGFWDMFRTFLGRLLEYFWDILQSF